MESEIVVVGSIRATMKVFYNKQQQVKVSGGEFPSLEKPKWVVQSWQDHGHPVEIMPVRPLTVDEICLAHEVKYVKGIIGGRIKNGFDNKDRAIAKTLPWTTGSLVSAAVHAVQHQESTFSPTAGFHHARYNNAAGYCTFSGLTIAAIILHQRYGAKRVGILDLDSHFGDGTDHTILKSKSGSFIEHYSLGYLDVDLYNNAEWLGNLSTVLRSCFEDSDVILYQAGVDCHVDDPYVEKGEFSSEQILERDQIVYRTFKELGIPVVTNLGGGYQVPLQKVIELHDLTAQAYLETQNEE